MPLFKYVNPGRVDVIQNLAIRFSPPEEFNDPFELLPHMKIVETREWIDKAKRHVVSESKKKLPHLSEEEVERIFLQRYPQRIPTQKRIALEIARQTARLNRILSLCKTAPDDSRALLMWAHYTQDHAGMVLEFDDAHAWLRWHDYKKGHSHNRADVIYSAKRAEWNDEFPADEFLYTKSEHWFYEQEVRLMRFAGDKDFDTSKVDALVKFPADLLRSVTLGVNNTTEKAVRDALNAKPDLLHVVLNRADLHPDEYRLTLTVLPR